VSRFLFAVLVAVLCLAGSFGPAAAYDGIDVRVDEWSSSGGRAYIGVKANGHWAPPAGGGTRVRSDYYSEWKYMGSPQAYLTAWWVFVRRTADGTVVNYDSPIATHTSSRAPGIGVRPFGYGDLSLFLSVSVAPVTAPALSERTVTTELTAGWRDFVDDAISAYVRRDTIRVERWTIDFGDGTLRVFPADRSIPDRLVTTHAYGPGEFDVIATARVSGQAYGAFFTPAGTPYESVVPFSLDISNRASGVAALPIEYIPPVVSVGGSPSGTLPDGRAIGPDAAGHAAINWPRGLPCELFVRAVVEQEGFMRSGGVRIGGATTRLVRYRYLGDVNDASDASAAGMYEADVPIRLQWNTPRPKRGTYPVRVELTVETTYDDGTVRTFAFAGAIGVTVVYSAVSD
jgi:hypothetical protein